MATDEEGRLERLAIRWLWLGYQTRAKAAWPVGFVVFLQLMYLGLFPNQNATPLITGMFATLVSIAAIALSLARCMTDKKEKNLRKEFLVAAVFLADAAMHLIPAVIVYQGLQMLYGGKMPTTFQFDLRMLAMFLAWPISCWYLAGALAQGVVGFDRLCRTLWFAYLYLTSSASSDDSDAETPAPVSDTDRSSTTDSEPPNPVE